MMRSLLVLLVSIFPVHAVILSIIGSNLIDQTCKQTPYYELCVWSLISNPQSFSTDVKGLAKIMVFTIDAKATHTVKHINNLLQRSSSLSEKERQELKACADRYSVIIKGDVPQSIDALRTGDYKFAQEGTYDAATEAMSCEEEFSCHHSKLSDMNMVLHDVSVVAASIVKVILSS
ncbi:cell wall / vacuolar inhibitor of fructosidase 1 [Hevea brasiliensis]|nr:cell wall / vacuolar inhibitor of fructosidase 1 [Hevea brasiliensis]